MDYNRKLSDAFMTDLKAGGKLSPLLMRIKEDDTLLLAIRDNYVNIYYRGGSLFKVEVVSGPSVAFPDSQSIYRVKFDTNYNKGYPSLPVNFPAHVSDAVQTVALVDAIPGLKFVMDRFFSLHGKSEREFQQLVARENNWSPIANETDYFIVDIEIAGMLANAKYDMLAVRWLSHERSRPRMLVPVLIEMKYGINALVGDLGLEKHLKDAYALKADEMSWGNLVRGLEVQIQQLDELELLKFNRSTRVERLEINKTDKPELIFLLANYNPASKKLVRFLEQVDKLSQSALVLIFCSSNRALPGMGCIVIRC